MSYEHRDGGGVLFKETEKKSEKAPDYRGNVMVGGKLYKLAGWIKAGAKGNFLSLKAEPDEGKPASKPQRADPTSIPF